MRRWQGYPGPSAWTRATVLGARAAAHESLWDAWGQVRPVLLRERGELNGEPA